MTVKERRARKGDTPLAVRTLANKPSRALPAPLSSKATTFGFPSLLGSVSVDLQPKTKIGNEWQMVRSDEGEAAAMDRDV